MSIRLTTALTTAAIATLTLGSPTIAAFADPEPSTPTLQQIAPTADDGSGEEIIPTDPIPDPEPDPEPEPEPEPIDPTPDEPTPTDPLPAPAEPGKNTGSDSTPPRAADTQTRGNRTSGPQLAATGNDLLLPGLATTALIGSGSALTLLRTRRRAAHRA